MAQRRTTTGESREKEILEEDDTTVVHAPIDRFGEVGLWIRGRLLAWSLYGTPLLVVVQNHRTPLLTTIMKAAGFLGEEEFYTAIICVLLWVIEVRLAFLFSVLMFLCFYVANVIKNVVRLPRPAAPPVKPLLKMHDWGFPSHHSLCGVALPWYLYFYTSEHWAVSTLNQTLFFFFVCLWSFLVMFDRLYLGVHSPADVVTGGFLGCALLAIFMQIDTLVEPYLTSSQAFWLVPLWAILLTLAHPESGIPNITRSETVSTMGIVVGFSIAQAHIKRRYPMLLALLERPGNLDASTSTIIGLSLIRLLLGFVIMEVLRQMMKVILRPLIFSLLRAFFGSRVYVSSKLCKTNITFYHKKTYCLPGHKKGEDDNESSEEASQSTPSPRPFSTTFSDKHIDSDIPMRLILYSFVGWLAFYPIALIFQYLSLTL